MKSSWIAYNRQFILGKFGVGSFLIPVKVGIVWHVSKKE
jgi:hypothetical protein